MYTTKFQNKNVAVDNGRYITVGDPYVDTKDKVPSRWKEKQFVVPQLPKNAGGEGCFGAFTYQGDKYLEQRPYLAIEPSNKRKLGFGTHDASRRDEFSQTIRTEQYRETLRKEIRRSPAVVLPSSQSLAQGSSKQFVAGKVEIRHLYDVGTNLHTEFDPKSARDQFYNMNHGYEHEKRMGNFRTASQDIGDGAWNYKYSKPQYSAPSQVKNFFDQSHLECASANL